jgi:SagB-type dehydrogenase family enzyme
MQIDEDSIPLNLTEQSCDEQDLTEIFHESTKFFRSTIFPQTARIVAFLTDPKLRDLTARGYKYDLTLPQIQLCEGSPLTACIEDVLRRRQSKRLYSGAPIAMKEIGGILHHAIRVNRTSPVPRSAGFRFRPYPSGGALYPVEFYIVSLCSNERAPFVGHYDPRFHRVGVLVDDFDPQAFLAALSNPSEASGVSLAIVLTSVFSRSTAKYGPRGYRFALLEAGHASQNLCLTALAYGVDSVLCGGFYDDEINRLCDVDGVWESAISCLFLGCASDDTDGKYKEATRA